MNRPYVECGSKKTSFKNTGAKKQCTLKKTVRYAVAVKGFSFDSIEDAKDKTKWDAAIADKKLFPLYDAEEYAVADTEAAYWEGENTRIETTPAKKIRTFRSILGLCSYNALKSFDGQEMQAFEFTTDPGVKAVLTADGKVKGQTVTLNVGRLQDSTAELPQNAVVTVNYKDFNEREDMGADLRPEWSYIELYGIFDAFVNVVSASSTEIKFTVASGCGSGDEQVHDLASGDVEVRDASGALVTVSFVAADSDGVYTVTGTGFATDYTIGLTNVVTVDDMNFESPEPTKITVA
ncbi:hypothetical protein MG290_01655 [Flavobacterium sp. CBA20B-1]|uniref:hypothetical protein n=1 Tax=unclassified Flavobacterium TaxID=196869 RepID=UPI0022243CF5|nr:MULTISPECIES: hypothetical protein [unclassified Flavobacterium]WCM42401.1 hypothetical protein MG290_01655 [Flavobacterium sp. CBA20B-1]